jgi:pimeloyl-ACP methyl ester carboxylesterase
VNGPGVLAHRVDGRGDPLLLLNGGMMSYAAWDDFVPPLAERFRVVRCDFRGQLRSPGEVPATFDGHADDLLALLDHLGIARAHVVGTSFGGFAAIHLAARAPDRVASLTAITVTDRVSAEMSREALALAAACGEARSGGSREAVYDLIAAFAFSPAWAAAHAGEIAARRALVAHLPEVWFSGLASLLGALDALDLNPLLPGISCPALVLLADGDLAMPLERGRVLASALPRGELVVVGGAGHAVVVEKPRETLEHLLAFLARHPLAGEALALQNERDGGTS